MKLHFILIISAMLIAVTSFPQVAINSDGSSPDASSLLDLKSINKGLLVPRMKAQERTAIMNPAVGLLVYQTDEDEGFYYNTDTQSPVWFKLKGGILGDISWKTSGNSGTVSGLNFLGTIDKKALDIRTENTVKVRITTNGQIEVLNTGNSVFLGEGAGINDNLTENKNVAVGDSALSLNNVGEYNSAVGYKALFSNIGGQGNTALGYQTLYSNEYGYENIAIGKGALYSNRGNTQSIAIGLNAMYYANDESTITFNTDNVAVGNFALQGSETPSDNTGKFNTALGTKTLKVNTSGTSNTAVGINALQSNTSGSANTSVGSCALCYNVLGSNNTTIGNHAGFNYTGSGSVFLGNNAGFAAAGDSLLYIHNANDTIPLIYGNFVSKQLGFGTNNPGAKLEIRSTTGESPLWVRINTVTKLKVHPNGSVSIGTFEQGPQNGLIAHGDMVPTNHKSYDLGTSSKAWRDLYYDDAHNMGASAFSGRNPTEEILNYPPKEKLPGSFDYKTERGDVELDPASMPPGLSDENSLLTDEISSYNYKTNYEQQLQIDELKAIVKKQNEQIEALLKLLQEDK